MIAKKLVLAGVIAAAALGGTAVVLDQVSRPSEAPPAAVTGRSAESGVPQPSGTGTGEAPAVTPAPTAALIRIPLPASASAQGKVVDGFPANVVTFPERTVVVSTDVSSQERTLQARAVGIVDLTPVQTTDYFQQTLLALGFQPESVATGDGRSISFARGADTVTVAITTTGAGKTRFTLLATLHA
jgi:hypothetical protein